MSLQDEYDKVALHKACERGHLECAKALLGAGADINKQTNYGKTPLILAANNDNIEVVKELLKAGANKKLKNKYGETAYDLTCGMVGVDQSKKEGIKALLALPGWQLLAD